MSKYHAHQGAIERTHSVGSGTEENCRSRRKRPSAADRAEEAIRRAGSIGALERLAGIEQTSTARSAFWLPYVHIQPPAASLDAGVAELKRRIWAAVSRAGAP